MIIKTNIILAILVIIAMKREITKKKERTKNQEKPMMHNTICHCLLTDTQPVPEQ